MRHDEYVRYDGLGLAKSRTAVTATEVFQAAIARRNAVNPAINAVVESWDEQARAAAEGLSGPFGGVPFLIRTWTDTWPGTCCTYSSRSLEDWIPQRSSELFVRFEKAGLNIFSKTSCPEFGIMGVSEPELRGPARNPWNLQRTPGGSSGGSAAAIAAGIVPRWHTVGIAAFAADPRVQLRHLRTQDEPRPGSAGPDEGEGWDGLVVRLLMSRSVRDTAAALDAVRGADPVHPTPRPTAPSLPDRRQSQTTQTADRLFDPKPVRCEYAP